MSNIFNLNGKIFDLFCMFAKSIVKVCMEENLDNLNEEATVSLKRYKKMLQSGELYYFDIFELEHIIDYFIDDQDFNNAGNAIEYSLQLHPSYLGFKVKKAQVLISTGQHYKSLKILNTLSKIESSNSNVFFLKGVVYATLGEIKRALNEFENSVSLEYNDKTDLIINIASTFQQVGQYKLAVKFYEQATDTEPEDGTVSFELAYCLEKVDKDNDAAKYYKKYIGINPFSKMAWYNLGNIYHKTEQYELAIDAMDFAIAIDPEYSHAYYQKGLNEVYFEKYDAGIKSFNDYLNFDSNSASAIFHIGEAYAKKGDNQKALDYFNKTISLDGEYADAYYGKSYVLFSEKKYSNAYNSIKNAVSLESDDYDFWHLMALINQNLGLIEESEKAFKRAIDIESKDPQVWIDYSNLQKGSKKLLRRIDILSKAYEHITDNAEINYRLAANLALVCKVEPAAYHLKKALKKEPGKLEIFRSIYGLKNSVFEDLINKYNFGKFNFDMKN